MKKLQIKVFSELTVAESMAITGGREVRQNIRGTDGRLYSVVKTYNNAGQLLSMSVEPNPFG